MKHTVVVVTWMMAAVLAANVYGTSGTLLLNVKTAPLPWADPQLYEKLVIRLSREVRLQVVKASDGSGVLPSFPGDRNNADSLISWGQEAGARFLMVVTVDSERLERKKSFSLPLVFHKWETVGIIEGEMRLYDIARGKLLAADPFEVELKGPRAFQGSMDDNRHDPSIHISAVRKLAFFGKLEDRLADRLASRVTRVLRNR
jgi:hypothetical protein